jgi:hypothetical protein
MRSIVSSAIQRVASINGPRNLSMNQLLPTKGGSSNESGVRATYMPLAPPLTRILK